MKKYRLMILVLLVVVGIPGLCSGQVYFPAFINVPSTAQTPPVIDDTSASRMVDWGASIDLALTVGSNANRVLLAGGTCGDEDQHLDSVVWVVTSPASRQQLTKIVSINHGDPGQSSRSEAWGLSAPNSGAGTVSYYIHTGNWYSVGAVSFYNANQTNFTNWDTASVDYGTTSSISITSATNEIVVDIIEGTNTVTWTKDASQTLLSWCIGVYESMGMSYKAHPVTSMVWTSSNAVSTRIAVRVKPL